MKKQHRRAALLAAGLAGIAIWWGNRGGPDTPESPAWEPLAKRIRLAIETPGERPKAEDLRQLLQHYQSEPDNPRLRLLRARVSWRIGNLEHRIAAKTELQDLSTGNHEQAVSALMDLALLPLRQGVFEEDILQAADLLLQHPLSNPAARLRAADILLAATLPAKHKDILAMAVHKVRAQDKALLGNWLTGKGHPRLTLAAISEEEARTQPQFFLPRFQALLATRQIQPAQELIDHMQSRLDPATLAKAHAHLGVANADPATITRYLDWAHEHQDYAALADAGRLALLNNRPGAARAAYATVLEQSPEHLDLDACTQLLQLALHVRETGLALQAAKTLQNRSPYHPAHQNNLNWLMLLSGADPELLLQEARQTLAANPRNPSFISTLALAHHLAGNPDAANQTLRRRHGAPLQPSEKALLAATLFAQNKNDEARKWARDIAPAQMLPEEWALLKPYGPELVDGHSATGN